MANPSDTDFVPVDRSTSATRRPGLLRGRTSKGKISRTTKDLMPASPLVDSLNDAERERRILNYANLVKRKDPLFETA